jgi:predicted MFS family arabinose efflux permease
MSTATATLVPSAPAAAPARTHSAARPRLVTGPLLRLLVVELGAMTGFYLLVAVVPMYAASLGAGGLGAGLSTAALMLASVAAECVTPSLARRVGYPRLLAAGLVLLGLPALALPLVHGTVGVLAVSVVRGLGFAVVVVAVGAMLPAAVPAERRGEGLGLVGVAGALPAVVALPLGVWLVSALGFTVAFTAGALASVVTVAAVIGLPAPAMHADEPVGLLAGLRTPAIARPALVFAATAVASGAVVTFLPGAAGDRADLAAAALLVQAGAATLTRWWAGRHVDRGGRGNLLLLGALAVAAGMLALALVPGTVAVLLSMVAFGAGFGAAQSASMTAMLARVPASGFATVSAVWNMAYDLGWGAGAAGIGLVVAGVGHAAGFAVSGVLVLVVAGLARRVR